MNTLSPEKQEPKFIRNPWQWLKWWWTEKPPTHRSSAFIALWAIFAAGLLTILASLVIKFVGPTGNVPGYILAIACGVCLSAGIALAWWLTRKFYELLVRTSAAELEKVKAQHLQVGAELELEREKLASFEPSEETLRRFGEYSEHLYNLTGTLISGEVSLRDLKSDVTVQSICKMTQKHLLSAAQQEFKVSIWSEVSDPRVRDRLRDAVNDLTPVGELHDKRKFEILAAPEHTANERENFEVRIGTSWLKHCQRQEEDHAEELVYEADEPHLTALRGDDISAFTEHGYQSVRAISFQRDEMRGYLVVVSKVAQAFTQIEERYLLWLKRILELDMVISRNGTL
ncbi:MAG TPA: hypothetical protein VIJ50_00240 [Solirubrobacteraceae bacterium]